MVGIPIRKRLRRLTGLDPVREALLVSRVCGYRRAVLVHTMGKVGSTSVRHSVQRMFPRRAIFQTHFITPEGLERGRRFHAGSRDSLPEHLWVGERLGGEVTAAPQRWHVITIVRDPVAREVSDLFQNYVEHTGQLGDGSVRPSVDTLVEYLLTRVRGLLEPGCHYRRWFVEELERPLAVDVLAHPFDRQRGYGMLHDRRRSVLILCLEKLDCCFGDAMAGLFHLKRPPTLVRGNVGMDKEYAEEYREVRKRFTVPSDLLEQIYSVPLLRHFYSDEDIAKFKARWAESAKP